MSAVANNLDNIKQIYFVCILGYTGVLCDFNINECASNPCLNSGQCQNLDGFYQCSCTPEYTGTNCEVRIDINSCIPNNPCLNNVSEICI